MESEKNCEILHKSNCQKVRITLFAKGIKILAKQFFTSYYGF